jgi:hypothetical protein
MSLFIIYFFISSEIPNDVVVVDVERDRILNLGPGGALQIPRFKELEIKVKPLYKELLRELPVDPRQPNYTFASEVVYHLVEEICTTMKAHLSSLFSDFHKHCIKDLTDNNKPISVCVLFSSYSLSFLYLYPHLVLQLATQKFGPLRGLC